MLHDMHTLWTIWLVKFCHQTQPPIAKEVLCSCQILYLEWALYKKCVDVVYRRCALEDETGDILYYCHSSSYGGHASTSKTATKVLWMGFYWFHIFKDAREYVLPYDRCQRIENISRRHEMSLNSILEVELFYVWELITWDYSHHLAITIIF